jgi:hypothetical protein
LGPGHPRDLPQKAVVGHFELSLWPDPNLSGLWLHSPNPCPRIRAPKRLLKPTQEK